MLSLIYKEASSARAPQGSVTARIGSSTIRECKWGVSQSEEGDAAIKSLGIYN